MMTYTLAWQRIQHENKTHRAFTLNLFEESLVNEDTNGWLSAVESKLGTPSAALIIDVPKPNNGIRPGTVLSTIDRVLYNYLVGQMLPNIYGYIEWSDNQINFAHLLVKDLKQVQITENYFKGWERFGKESLRIIDEGAKYVVVTDISAFYENIDITMLNSDLRSIGILDNNLLNQLRDSLIKWSPNGKGIPQGHSASDILSKVYLNVIDIALKEMGYKHLRYSDDMRIFCNSLPEAKQVIVDLARLLRSRGLTLHSAKTDILKAKDAKKEFEEKFETIIRVNNKYAKEVYKTTGLGNPYMSVFQTQDLVKENSQNKPIPGIRAAFRYHFMRKTKKKKFNSTLFHFLLRKLAVSKDKYAVVTCVEYLASFPEETKFILDYVSDVEAYKDMELQLNTYLTSPLAIYDYQIYTILTWIAQNKLQPSPSMLAFVRKIAFNRAKPAYLRSVSRYILAFHGSPADLDRLLETYADSDSDLEKAEIICSVVRLETSRRNSFYAQVINDGDLQRRAVKFSKQKFTTVVRTPVETIVVEDLV